MQSNSSNSLLNKVVEAPWRFEFFQLARLLEEHYRIHDTNEIGDFTPASKETIKFQTNPQLTFEPAPVKSIQQGDGTKPTELLVNFWGLNGSSGVLPFHYSELIIQQLRKNDESLKDFVDLFNHRSLSLFFRAWKKHRPWLKETSKDKANSKYQKNWHKELLKGLVGLSTEDEASFNKPEGAWLNYAGFGASRIASPSMLTQAIHHHFGLHVRIKEFKGQWESMPIDVRTKLADRKSDGTNNQLGMSAILGERCWNVQNRFELEVLDIKYTDFMTFAPGSQKLHDLYELIKFKVGTELDFDLTLKIKEKDLEATSFTPGRKPQLGWNTRLSSSLNRDEETSDRVIKISVSEHGMHRLAVQHNTTLSP